MKEINDRVGEQAVWLSQVYDALENLSVEKAAQRISDERARTGLKSKNQSIVFSCSKLWQNPWQKRSFYTTA